MDARSLKYVSFACAGLLNGPAETEVTRVCTDSRQAQSGDLFFALSGEKFDGHDFLAEVDAKGVAAVVVERARVPGRLRCAVIGVENPRHALGALAAKYRQDFAIPVIAVGGSNGKTTTKELIAAVLRQKWNTLWSEASFNNDIGVPVTLLRLESAHQAAVLEAGTNHPGELAPLVQMIQPRIGVITNIGREHLEFFGDVEGVAREEGSLAELLPADGKLFLNGDNEWTARIARRARVSVTRVGFGDGNDWRASALQMDARGMTFKVETRVAGFAGEYRINLLGKHQVTNALFAVAIGADLGMTREEVQRGLAECKPAKMRLQPWDWNGVCVLDDAYNANADSMRAALETLRQMPCAGRRAAVLGDMGELGEHSESAHREVGRMAAENAVNQLFAIGKMAEVMAAAARAAGLKNVETFAEPAAAAGAVRDFLRAGDVLLLKASRATHLEKLADALKAVKR